MFIMATNVIIVNASQLKVQDIIVKHVKITIFAQNVSKLKVISMK